MFHEFVFNDVGDVGATTMMNFTFWNLRARVAVSRQCCGCNSALCSQLLLFYQHVALACHIGMGNGNSLRFQQHADALKLSARGFSQTAKRYHSQFDVRIYLQWCRHFLRQSNCRLELDPEWIPHIVYSRCLSTFCSFPFPYFRRHSYFNCAKNNATQQCRGM